MLRTLTNGSITGTGTLSIPSCVLGGLLITADGTNDTTVVIRRNDDAGKIICKLVTKQPKFIRDQIVTEDAKIIYYSISGTGGAAQIYEFLL